MQLAIQSYRRSRPLLCILSIFLFCFGTQAFGQEVDQGPIIVIKKFSRDLYVTAETTGGSVEEWALLEEQATSAMIAAFKTAKPHSDAIDFVERTALHLAAGKGYLFLVEVILDDDLALTWIDATDRNGLTAYEHALLALPETLMACHPKIENPFVLVPLSVLRPYYVSRKPFPKIVRKLAQAGADQSTEGARDWWLSKCSNQDSTARSEVAGSKDLYASLSKISLDVISEDRRMEIEVTVRKLAQVMNLMPAETRPTPEEMKEIIDEVYRKNGLQPPD
jgi:hypothetical protein